MLVTRLVPRHDPGDRGQDVTVEYTVGNLGDAPAGPFDAEVRLSADGRVGPTGLLLGTVRVTGVAARSATSESATFRLPAAPAGFGAAGGACVSLLVDPPALTSSRTSLSTTSPEWWSCGGGTGPGRTRWS